MVVRLTSPDAEALAGRWKGTVGMRIPHPLLAEPSRGCRRNRQVRLVACFRARFEEMER